MDVKLEMAPAAAGLAEDCRCRCCYAEVSTGIRLDESSGEVCEIYFHMLVNTFSITWSASMSDHICEPCGARLRDASAFRRLVLATDLLFQQVRPGSSQLVEAVLVKEEIVESAEEEDGVTWDNDYLNTDDYIDEPLPPKVEAVKVKKETHRERPIAGVFKPVDKNVQDLLIQKSTSKSRSHSLAKQPALGNFTKMLTGNVTVKKSFTSKPPTATRPFGGVHRSPVKIPAAKVTGKLLSVSKSNALASKLLYAKEKLEAKARAGERRAKLNVDSILKALNFRSKVKVKVEPGAREDVRLTVKRGPLVKQSAYDVLDKRTERQVVKQNVILLLKHTTICPFISFRGNFRCLYCGETFFNFDDLRAHTNDVHADLNNAVRAVHSFKDIVHVDITTLRCRKCLEDFTDVDAIKEHLVNEHKVKINMKHKDDVIPFKLSGTESRCHLCSEEFHVFRNLSLHMNHHFPNYVCEVCGKSFVSAKRCASHEDSHRKGTFPCTKCSKVFDSANARSGHTLEHRETKYRCPRCPERFEKYLQRTVHMSEVHGVTRTFRCPQPDCDREFIHKPQFAAHVRTHGVKEKKVVCAECGMRFQNNYALKKHMVSHTGERPFQCKVCGKKYGRKNTLREHMRIHENDRRHVCAECGQGFVQKCSLNGHMKTRHPHALLFPR